MRGAVGNATMFAPGGRSTPFPSLATSSVLGSSAALIGSEFPPDPRYGLRPLYSPWPRSFRSIPSSFARPSLAALLCVARDLGWCEHVYLRWGGHSLTVISATFFPKVLVTPASLIGSELLDCSQCGAGAFICLSLPLWGQSFSATAASFRFLPLRLSSGLRAARR